MWIGLSIDKFWEFATKQKILKNDINVISDFPDKSKITKKYGNPGIWVKLDDRYDRLGKGFEGYVFFNHISLTLPLTKEAKENLNQIQNMFSEIKKLLKRGDI